jgi:hypothetical protein
MKKLPYIVLVPFLVVVCVGVIVVAAVYALVSLVLDEINQRHNRLVFHQEISTFLAQERQKR